MRTWLHNLFSRERAKHDDRDYECRFWWGDRRGSMTARCRICREEP